MKKYLILTVVALVAAASAASADQPQPPSQDWQVKDVVSLVFSITSLITASYALFMQRIKSLRERLAELDDCIEKLIEVRSERELLRRELADEFGLNKNSAARIVLNDKRAFYASKARTFVDDSSLNASAFACHMVAAALADMGQAGESIKYYRLSLERETNLFGKAAALRSLGRALVLSGDVNQGIQELERAADLYRDLAKLPEYDTEQAVFETADVYRRMTWALIQIDERPDAIKALALFDRELERISDAGRLKILQEASKELRQTLALPD